MPYSFLDARRHSLTPHKPSSPLLSLPSYLNSRTRTVNPLHVVGWTSNIIPDYHSIDHRCFDRLHQRYWNRPLQEPLCSLHRTFNFFRSYPRTSPRTRKGIQRISRRESGTNQLPPPSCKSYPVVLWHPRRGSQPGEPYIPPGHSFSDFVRSRFHRQTHCLLASTLSLMYVP